MLIIISSLSKYIVEVIGFPTYSPISRINKYEGIEETTLAYDSREHIKTVFDARFSYICI